MNFEKNKSLEVYFDLVEDEILNLSEEELSEIYEVNNLGDSEEIMRFQSILGEMLTEHSKSKLLKARADLDRLRRKDHKQKAKFNDPKGIFINALQKGLIPKELTMAFRDGVDLSDEEMETILQDLIDLGINIFDE